MPGVWRPATGERWAVVAGGMQGGVSGWLRSIAIIIAVAVMLRIASRERCCGPGALGGAVFERKKAGGRTLLGCNFGNAAKVGLYAKYPCFLTVSRGNCFSCAFGKDEVSGSNPDSSSTKVGLFCGKGRLLF